MPAVNLLRRLPSRPFLWMALASLALHLLLFAGWRRVASVEGPGPVAPAPLLMTGLVPASGPGTSRQAPRTPALRARAVDPGASASPRAATRPAPASEMPSVAEAQAPGAAPHLQTMALADTTDVPARSEPHAAEPEGNGEPPARGLHEDAPARTEDAPARTEDAPARTEDAGPSVDPVSLARAPEPAADARPPAPAATRPPAALTTGRWQLRVHYGDYTKAVAVASLDYLVQVDGDRYEVRTEGRAEGLASLLYSGVLTQSSRGHLGPDGLEPEQFSEQRGKRPERRVEVDRARHRVRFADGTEQASLERAQDRLSVLLQLGVLARAHPEQFAAGRTVVVPEFTWRDIESARYLSHGEARLPTGHGELRTLHLERTGPRRDDDPTVELWLGYDHGLVPVRIRLTDPGGRVLDQMLVTQP